MAVRNKVFSDVSSRHEAQNIAFPFGAVQYVLSFRKCINS